MFIVVQNMQAGTLQTNANAGWLQMPESCGYFHSWYQVETAVVWVTELPWLLCASCCLAIATACFLPISVSTACQTAAAMMCNRAALASPPQSLRLMDRKMR